MRAHRIARHSMLFLIAFLSAGAGMALLWSGLTPEALAEMPAAQLFALLGLIGLPLATFMAIEADRRRGRGRRAPDDVSPAIDAPASDVRRHPRHDDRRALTHRLAAGRAAESSPARGG